MKLWLITHSEELKKSSGTGKLVKEALQQDCEIIEWSRVDPHPAILALNKQDTLLIYPIDQTQKQSSHSLYTPIKHLIILDGTWQQARKIYNRSPYLHDFTHHEIQNSQSTYSKRRNQKQTGLCTAEVAIHLLTEYQHPATSKLQQAYTNFNQ
ncbi:tRNA-uridine aminocarboxypropyltransferase [Marinomonas posidonica]|uniref:tRNA-uridine aminocarboxypropyltransferase n=1 Tax=Marinomonas posidonica (strain CECT 7376 / NCIMB 14433 / IVIA-Po-181) TaxID=491952 RepID=F6D120_MARPP|nr:tRNA-uridine aminocarboxypropyltransferase [Marinomonas posidonica]AEF53743.1 DTW domain containing protein [Marinomonas posidonica IVIA-Po-181]